jgi:UDP-2,4-diacetamido-2,4,6-trideoxy-beta-L-altropyranose hydrolase
VLFVSAIADGDMASWLEAAGYAVRRLQLALDAGWQEDAVATQAALAGDPPDLLLVDHYRLDARWERLLAGCAGKILAIDDLADRPHACDVLLDQNYHADAAARYAPHLPAGCLALLGPAYALLRPEFAEVRARARRRGGPTRRLLCFFGAADAANATGLALDALALLARPGLAIDVVVGAANPWRAQIEQQCASLPQTRFLCQVETMAELMQAADLCVGAGGSASWERCCLGLPSLVLTVADNQVEVARALDALGCLRYLGRAAETGAAALARALAELLDDDEVLRAMGARGAALVDGRGAARVAAALQAAAVSLRRATLDDQARLLAWRNAPEVRAASFDPRMLTREEHQRWLRAVLADPARHLLVAELGGQPVAVLRYDVAGAEAEVSIFLLPGLAGRGIGTAVLRAGSRWLQGVLPQTGSVRARILPSNPASRAAFRKAGYQPSGDDFIFALHTACQPHPRIP